MLSVVMPTFNDAPFIREALDAIFNQSYKDFELIVINDGSTDETHSIVQEYASQHRMRYLINPANQGAVKTINRGCLAATGNYLMVVSSDDFLAEGIFEQGVRLLEKHSEKPLCFFDVVDFQSNRFFKRRLIPHLKQPTPLSPSDLLHIHKRYNFFIPGHTTIVKRTELEKIGFFAEELGYFCDLFAHSQIALEKGALYIPQVGAFIRMVPQEGSRCTAIPRGRQLLERDRIVTHFKKDQILFKKLCFSTILPRAINYKYYTLFINRKHWDVALPMLFVKFKLMFTKLLRKWRSRSSPFAYTQTQGPGGPKHKFLIFPD